MDDQFNDDSVDSFHRLVKRNPTMAIENCQKWYAEIDGVHDNATYALIGFLYIYVATIKRSDKRVKELLSHRFWKKHKPKVNNISLAATRFALRAEETKTSAYERARIYSKIIDYYATIKVDPEDVPDRLAKAKIDGVLAQIAKLKEVTKEAGQSAEGISSEPKQPTATVVAKRADTVNRVSAVIPPSREDKDGVIRPNANDGGRGRERRDKEPRRRGFDLDGNNDDDLLPQPPSPIQINGEDDIYFSAGIHFSKFGRLRFEEGILVELRRKPDEEGRWKFEAVSAEVIEINNDDDDLDNDDDDDDDDDDEELENDDI